jgi:hypothetical protein
MGVFARLLGRSKATQEASAAEAQAGSEPEGAEAAAAEPAEAKSAEVKSAEVKGAESAEPKDSAEDGRLDVTARTVAGTDDDASGGADIPKQQSAEEAADNEAGDGARR